MFQTTNQRYVFLWKMAPFYRCYLLRMMISIAFTEWYEPIASHCINVDISF